MPQTIGDYFLDGAIAAAIIFLLAVGYAAVRDNISRVED